MSELVERLRRLIVLDEVGSDNPLCHDAADRIEALEAALKLSDEALGQMLIWMPSGFAPQSQANAMRLAHAARGAIAALAPETDK